MSLRSFLKLGKYFLSSPADRVVRAIKDPASLPDKLLSFLARHSLQQKWNQQIINKNKIDFEEYHAEEIPQELRFKIACILDTFSFQCFKFEADLKPLSYLGWEVELRSFRPDILLVESVWRGSEGDWSMQTLGEMRRLVDWCKRNNIPTVFWNKEDPPNYERFLPMAELFDYVFTSDQNMISRYQEDLGHNNIYSLSFAAQPRIHNPMGRPVDQYNVCFAGTWYGRKHPNRKTALECLLRPAQNYQLHIFDRQLNYTRSSRYVFPVEFHSAIKGTLTYPKMLSAYRAYKVFLNVNSVDDSPTMFARRVYELLACGTSVISSESVGVRNLFSDVVDICTDENQTQDALETLLQDENARQKRAHLGYRKVMLEHTYQQRLETILEKLKVQVSPSETEAVMAFLVANDLDVQRAREIFDSQIFHKKRLLLLCLDSNIHEQLSDSNEILLLGDNGTRALIDNLVQGDILFLLNPAISYGSYYVSDLVLPFKYTRADIVGKACYYHKKDGQLYMVGKEMEHKYSENLHSWSVAIKVKEELRAEIEQFTSQVLWSKKRLPSIKLCFYSSDKYNFMDPTGEFSADGDVGLIENIHEAEINI